MVLPVVHIARRKPWEEVAAAEKEMADLAPVTAPAPNRSGTCCTQFASFKVSI